MARTITPLNEDWNFVKSAEDISAALAASGETISLPHTWNAKDGQDGGNDYFRSTCYYIKELTRPVSNPGDQVYLELNGAAMIADVYVNGRLLAHHEGGYSAFRVNITDILADENTIAVSVNNEDNTICYPQKADFTFYGGLYRMVNLLVVPQSHFDLDYYGSTGIKVTPKVDLKTKTAVVTAEAWTSEDDTVTFTLNGQSKTVKTIDHYAKTEFIIEQVHLWDGLADPYLYTAEASLESGDAVSTRFGCREFHIDPQEGFFLNGRSYPLRGVSRHQDFQDAGNALTMEHHKRDMEIIRELGANTLRLAHYQQHRNFMISVMKTD